jgi:hypothetical protein
VRVYSPSSSRSRFPHCRLQGGAEADGVGRNKGLPGPAPAHR